MCFYYNYLGFTDYILLLYICEIKLKFEFKCVKFDFTLKFELLRENVFELKYVYVRISIKLYFMYMCALVVTFEFNFNNELNHLVATKNLVAYICR